MSKKGSKILPKIEEKGLLTNYGYHLRDAHEKRIKAIDKAAKKEGYLKLLRHLNLIRNYSKSIERNYNKYTKDIEYLKTAYKKEK